jgi:hypothetical protein
MAKCEDGNGESVWQLKGREFYLVSSFIRAGLSPTYAKYVDVPLLPAIDLTMAS